MLRGELLPPGHHIDFDQSLACERRHPNTGPRR